MIIPPENLEDIARKFGFGKYAKEKRILVPVTETEKHNFTDEDILNGKIFYGNKKNSDGLYVGVPIALKEALEYTSDEGIVASMPYLIAGKAKSDATNYLWKNWFTALSEENVGIDKHGVFNRGNPVLVVVHGGGLWTPERIEKAYTKELTEQNAGKLTEEEFNELLKGRLPDKREIVMYAFRDFMKMKIPPTQNYGIVINFDIAKNTKTDNHTKEEFMNNPVVIARAGGLEHLEAYFDKAAAYHPEKNKVGSWHRFNEINPLQHQGRLLFLYYDYNGLYGSNDLNNYGRFVGLVAPEAPSARRLGKTK